MIELQFQNSKGSDSNNQDSKNIKKKSFYKDKMASLVSEKELKTRN